MVPSDTSKPPHSQSAPPDVTEVEAPDSTSRAGAEVWREKHTEQRGQAGRGNSRSRGARGGQHHKKRDMGRKEWSRDLVDKRARNAAEQQAAKQLKLEGKEIKEPIYAVPYSKEEIEAEERKPKRKVAVMIGYSGSGYKGMQLNHHEKTIEGDLFSAFVAAGAISKANANDPKKSSLVRCARTDKGVHAAGNLISLKLIIEDSDIVKKINDNLSSQIRVWGIERTNGSFSAYQFCGSRIYEYLIPTHSFLPPHPSTYLGKKLEELADEADDRAGYERRQSEVSSFWTRSEEEHIKPILDKLDPSLRWLVMKALYEPGVDLGIGQQEEINQGTSTAVNSENTDSQKFAREVSMTSEAKELNSHDRVPSKDAAQCNMSDSGPRKRKIDQDPDDLDESSSKCYKTSPMKTKEEVKFLSTSGVEAEPPEHAAIPSNPEADLQDGAAFGGLDSTATVAKLLPKREDLAKLDAAVKELKAAYLTAKKAYRIDPDRLARIRSSLTHYLGMRNYHNFTIRKDFRDASAKRFIKSFVVDEKPIIINNTEWLSLKVHGQSFMMHQIRKMVSMVALVVRCGSPESRIPQTFGRDKFNIPKAPGLGLLLERPVFDEYNKRLVELQRNKLEFTSFEREMGEFKQREIYERIFREEERDSQFHTFFTSIDHFKSPDFLYLSSVGIEATKRASNLGSTTSAKAQFPMDNPSSDEDDDVEDG